VLAPLPVAPVNEADTVLLPDGLNALKRVARLTDLKIDGSYLNLDGGFDSRHNRKAIFNAGLVPNIKSDFDSYPLKMGWAATRGSRMSGLPGKALNDRCDRRRQRAAAIHDPDHRSTAACLACPVV
jgi:hypothetical protein